MLRAASRVFTALRPPPSRALHALRQPPRSLLAASARPPPLPSTLVLLCRFNSTVKLPPADKPKPSISSILQKNNQGLSSFRKVVALAVPERNGLLIAVGLLLVSSAVTLSVPFTIGRLIDFFSSPNPVSLVALPQLRKLISQANTLWSRYMAGIGSLSASLHCGCRRKCWTSNINETGRCGHSLSSRLPA